MIHSFAKSYLSFLLLFLAVFVCVPFAQNAFASEPNEYAVAKKSNYNVAVQESKNTGRPIMVVFSGSDWCGWCRRLDQEVLGTGTFAKWSNDNVVLVEADFPRTTALPAEQADQNQWLKQKYGDHVQSYPTVLFLNSNQQVIGKTGFVAGGPENWIRTAQQAIAQDGTVATK